MDRRDVRLSGIVARLVTIPISHFCEKARWALDRAGVEYVEQRHLQLLHVLAARFAGGGRTVPVFVTDAGDVLADSTAILRWSDRQVAPGMRLYPDGALAAPMLLPARYGSPLAPPEEMPHGLAREVERLRAHPAGAYADRLYNEERTRLRTAPTWPDIGGNGATSSRPGSRNTR